MAIIFGHRAVNQQLNNHVFFWIFTIFYMFLLKEWGTLMFFMNKEAMNGGGKAGFFECASQKPVGNT